MTRSGQALSIHHVTYYDSNTCTYSKYSEIVLFSFNFNLRNNFDESV